MIGSVRALGAAGAVAALLVSGACGSGSKDGAAPGGRATATPVVLLKTYDPATGALRYQATTKVQEPDEAILASGPLHEVTVARNATVLGAVNICSGDDATVDRTGNGTKPCTLDQLAAALRAGAQVDAYLTMRGRTVVKITEVYHP